MSIDGNFPLHEMQLLFSHVTFPTSQEQLTDEINRKLANKVLLNVGLCLCLYDIIEMAESFIFPGSPFYVETD